MLHVQLVEKHLVLDFWDLRSVCFSRSGVKGPRWGLLGDKALSLVSIQVTLSKAKQTNGMGLVAASEFLK